MSAFAEASSHKDETEAAFGGPLDWQGLCGKRACRIAWHLPGNEFRDDDSMWPEMHKQMIEAMVRFEKAITPRLRPVKDKIDRGEL